MGIRFLKIAAIYLVVGVSMGLWMGITRTFALHPVHAHINLVGWATLALAGMFYVPFPAAGETRLARIHFWMHNLSLPVFMVALTFLLRGHAAWAPAVEVAATATAVGIAIFVINVWINVRARQPGSEAKRAAMAPVAR